jgi:hypothetical protein
MEGTVHPDTRASAAGALPEQKSLQASVGWALQSFRQLRQAVTTWRGACVDYYAAAALYEQLSGLSDSELRRRGLSRDELARHTCAHLERPAVEPTAELLSREARGKNWTPTGAGVVPGAASPAGSCTGPQPTLRVAGLVKRSGDPTHDGGPDVLGLAPCTQTAQAPHRTRRGFM